MLAEEEAALQVRMPCAVLQLMQATAVSGCKTHGDMWQDRRASINVTALEADADCVALLDKAAQQLAEQNTNIARCSPMGRAETCDTVVAVTCPAYVISAATLMYTL